MEPFALGLLMKFMTPSEPEKARIGPLARSQFCGKYSVACALPPLHGPQIDGYCLAR